VCIRVRRRQVGEDGGNGARIGAGFGGECRQRVATLAQQAITPALREREPPLLPLFFRVALREEFANSRLVGIPHQPADELLLPANGFVGFHAAEVVDGLDEPLVEGKRRAHVRREADQAFAQRLQGMLLPLSFRFAGSRVVH